MLLQTGRREGGLHAAPGRACGREAQRGQPLPVRPSGAAAWCCGDGGKRSPGAAGAGARARGRGDRDSRQGAVPGGAQVGPPVRRDGWRSINRATARGVREGRGRRTRSRPRGRSRRCARRRSQPAPTGSRPERRRGLRPLRRHPQPGLRWRRHSETEAHQRGGRRRPKARWSSTTARSPPPITSRPRAVRTENSEFGFSGRLAASLSQVGQGRVRRCLPATTSGVPTSATSEMRSKLSGLFSGRLVAASRS